uniref:Uncharacterized protein n=1 Tax=Caenorhabditis japonica TaxID=281687 RepID=A0A8R1IFE5_CAEJA
MVYHPHPQTYLYAEDPRIEDADGCCCCWLCRLMCCFRAKGDQSALGVTHEVFGEMSRAMSEARYNCKLASEEQVALFLIFTTSGTSYGKLAVNMEFQSRVCQRSLDEWRDEGIRDSDKSGSPKLLKNGAKLRIHLFEGNFCEL